MAHIFEHDYCDETWKTMRSTKPLAFIKYLGIHRHQCSRCYNSIEKYKEHIKEMMKTDKAPDVLGMGD